MLKRNSPIPIGKSHDDELGQPIPIGKGHDDELGQPSKEIRSRKRKLRKIKISWEEKQLS